MIEQAQHRLFERIEKQQYLFSLCGSVSSRLATLAVLILLPAQLGLHDYGLFALVITLGEIIEMTASNWFRLLLIRQSLHSDAIDSAATRRPTFAALAALTAAIGVLAAFASAPLLASPADLELGAAVAIYIVNFAVLRLVLTLLQAQNRQGLFGLVETIRGFAMLVLVFGMLLAGQLNFFAVAIAFSVSSGLATLVSLPVIAHGARAMMTRRLAPGSFAAIAIPTILVTALTFQFGWIDRLLLQTWLGPSMVGLYVAATAVARQPVDLVLFALNQQAFPAILAQHRTGHGDKQIAGFLVASCILGFGAAGGCIALAQPLVDAVLPSFDRTLAAMLIAPIAIGSVALGIKHVVFDNIFHSYGRNWLLLGYLCVVSLATLALSLVLVRGWGPAGASIAFMLGSCVAVGTAAVVSRRVWRFEFPAQAMLRVLVCTLAAVTITMLVVANLAVGPWIALVVGGVVYGATYFIGLVVLMRFNMRRFVASPWDHDSLARPT